MPMPTALIKCSSRLLGRKDVTDYVQGISKTYALRFLSGGGEQISAEFEKRGWPIVFDRFGRLCANEEQRLVAEMILKMNGTLFEDQLQRAGILGHIVLPVLDSEVGQVTCHVNGDMYPIICHNGYDQFFVFTMKEDVEQKRLYYQWQWQINGLHLKHRFLPTSYTLDPDDHSPKIKVVGFDKAST